MISFINASILHGERPVLSNCNVFFEKNSKIFIKGTSGSGKSSLMKVLIGQYKLSAGTLLIDGLDMSKLKAKNLLKLRRKIGVLLREPICFNGYTVKENLYMALEAIGWSSKETINKRIHLLLDKVNLLHQKETLVDILSFSEKRRLDLARALMNNPKIIIADEPTNNLDINNAELILKLLFELNEAYGSLLILMSSNDPIYRKIDFDYYTIQEGQLVKDEQ